jgi:hypothetical protein
MNYEERFDAAANTMRRRYSLDGIKLCFLTSYTLKGDTTADRYSFDIEKANDSHYTFSRADMERLCGNLAIDPDDNDFAEKLRTIVAASKSGESALVRLLETNGVKYQPFHYDDYDFEFPE